MRGRGAEREGGRREGVEGEKRGRGRGGRLRKEKEDARRNRAYPVKCTTMARLSRRN